ncbi:MAG TPA: hypothetical protein VJH05_02590 [Candidatus Paceibacterota bacterium]
MRVDVVLYNTQAGQKQNLEGLCPRDIEVPTGFKISGGQRKFIVLLSDNRDQVVVAIGELLSEKYYYHKDILRLAKKEFSECAIYGGGQVDFELQSHSPYWFAGFSGSSGDFGVFDKILLESEVLKSVAKAMNMVVHIEMKLANQQQP